MINHQNISKLGLGTVKFGRNMGVKYPEGDGFKLPSDAQIQSLLDLALDLGINLLDTAPAYGNSEERLGKNLGARREKFFLMSKTGEEFDGAQSEYIFTADHTRMSVERSLKRLDTDYLDCVLLHCNRDDFDAITKTDAMETLALLKEEGKILSFGASTYSVKGGLKALEISDAVMVAFNKNYTDERAVIDAGGHSGKMVFVKKGLASGHTQDIGDIGENLRYVTHHTPGVTAMVFGSLNPDNIRANVEALQGKNSIK